MTVKALLGLRILVAPLPDENEITESGIEVISNNVTKPKKGKIFLLGEGCNKHALHNGDTILYDRNDYPNVKSDNVDYDQINEPNVICVI